jgi:hypothetical protein
MIVHLFNQGSNKPQEILSATFERDDTPFHLYESISVYCCRSPILRCHSSSSISSTTKAQQSLHSKTSAPDPVDAGPWSCRARAATSRERKGDAGRSHSSQGTQLDARFSVRKIDILNSTPGVCDAYTAKTRAKLARREPPDLRQQPTNAGICIRSVRTYSTKANGRIRAERW